MRYTLDEAKDLYDKARAKHGDYQNKCKLWYEQYNTGLTGTPKDPKMVYNFTKELINSQVSGNLPMPMVTPCQKSPRNIYRARVITAMLRSEMERLQSEEMNDRAERITRIMGGCLFLLEWDSTKKSHYTAGDITAKVVSPLDFVPQDGVLEFDEMDYWFVVFEDTKKRIAERYKKDVEELGGPEADREADPDSDMTTQVIMMYRNKNKGMGYITWAGECLLQDEPDYLVRKDKVCAKCGKAQSGEKNCDCGSTKWERRDRDGETLEIPLTLMDGTQIQPFEAEKDEAGGVAFEMVDGLPVLDAIGQPMPKLKPRKVPYYKIDVPSVVLRMNTTDETQLFGSSDCEDIKRLQSGCNIATDKISAKLAISGNFMTVPDDVNIEMTNEIGRVVKITDPAQMSKFQKFSLEFDAQQDFAVAQNAYQWAKSILGVTDVFQGKADPSVQSGISKELLIKQAQGIQRAKEILKESFFARFYEVLFKMMLAFADEERPYTAEGEEGEEELAFSRYDFLEMDETTGELYYEDDFIFGVDRTGTTEHDKAYMMQQIQTDYGLGAYGQPGTPEALLLLWKEREAVDYPRAKQMVKHWEAKLAEQRTQEQMMQQQMLGGADIGLPQM